MIFGPKKEKVTRNWG